MSLMYLLHVFSVSHPELDATLGWECGWMRRTGLGGAGIPSALSALPSCFHLDGRHRPGADSEKSHVLLRSELTVKVLDLLRPRTGSLFVNMSPFCFTLHSPRSQAQCQGGKTERYIGVRLCDNS